MQRVREPWTDEQVEQVIGNLLRFGVILSALIVFLGGAIYLSRHGKEVPDNQVRAEESERFRTIGQIVHAAFAEGSGRGIIQLGILLLIATPIARVIFSVYAFARQRDWTYVFVTLLVLAILLFSLIGESI